MKFFTRIAVLLSVSICFTYCGNNNEDNLGKSSEVQSKSNPESDDNHYGYHVIVLTLKDTANSEAVFNIDEIKGDNLNYEIDEEDTVVSLTSETLNDYFMFEEQTSSNIEDDTVLVHPSDIVVWIGLTSSDSPYDIWIKKIRYVNDPGSDEVLTERRIRGRNGVAAGYVRVNAQDDQIEKYKIIFSLVDRSTRKDTLTFRIDPKLQVHR